ncbi:general transcription factor 3C polypeptide 1 [Chelonus insularis]|uniref:general transcription factor 3C polypeptide 1 n=1 Tax=Chelonus insularis TaxID=460826 RepID=UPI00158F598D|nr:general transcription factor 3C polypeptide 1 [Chelonus insularis]
MYPSDMDDTFHSSSTNIIDIVIDEVALEGLDGITLEALWKRLSGRLQIQDNLPRTLQNQIWSICISTKEFTFYELDSPREPLFLYNRYEYVDPDLGIICEPDNLPEDIYGYYPIDDSKNNIRGSCKSYYTRKPIENIQALSLDVAEKKYGQTLVIVGSQMIREQALIDDNVCPTIELNVVQYCFLERVGRARYHGEVTQGKRSLVLLKEDPKSLFYYRKFLLKHKLITKQLHYQKNAGHGTGGSLLHLPRFYVERKPKIVYLAEKIIALLKTRENYLADYTEIKQALQIENSIKRLFKTACFQKVVRTDLLVPYRELYPHADPSEWARKSCATKEKKIRAVQLIDPNIDANDLWNNDEILDEEESYELDVTNQIIDVPIMKQANWIVEESRDEGLSQLDLAKKMGVTKLHARSTLKNLSKLGLIGTYMNDIGRQRLTKYVSKKFEKNSKISKQYHKEIHKMKELTKNINLSEYSFQGQFSTAKNFFYPTENSDVELLEEEKPAVDDPFKNIGEQQIRGQALFGIVNKIFAKYNLKKYKRGYEISFNNVSQMKNLKNRLDKLANKIKPSPRKVIKLITPDSNVNPGAECDAILEETRPSTTSDGEMKCLMKEINAEDLKITGSVTYRILKRANLIIEAVKEHKVIDDTTKLIKLINEEEEREGYDVKIDKKSLVRLLQKLAVDNLVKNIKLTLSANGKQKSLTFICDPSINVNHSVIRSAVEQARVKFCLTRFNKEMKNNANLSKNKNNSDNDLGKSTKKVKNTNDINTNQKIIPANLTFDPKAGKKYGYSPKFIRMQILHQFLYYLIYDHQGPLKIPREQQIQSLKMKGYQIDDELEKEMGEIYNTQVGWKMFVPPLPDHNGWPLGWALMCDILLRIPLSIFLKIYRLPFFIPNLDFYINHSIRKHYLIKDLPTLLRNALLLKRKYIFSIHETITRLSYIGLIQFGPQKLKEKDQIFIFLNKKSELMDTTTSAAGYHKIEDKEYPVSKYFFERITDVEKYWYDMWHICINTHLGGRLAVQGTEIILEDLTKKPEMLQCLKPVSAYEAKSLDIGIMPGDKKGAAGIDSAFFSHLKRNWNWDNFNSYRSPRDLEKKEPDPERKAHLSKVEAKPIKYTEFTGLKKKSGPTTVDANILKNRKAQKPVSLSTVEKTLKHKLLSKNMRKQSTVKVLRKVMPRKVKTRKRVKYDDIDYSALQHMAKLRVDWDPREDNILLVCKVVMLYLCPNPRKQLITFPAVRDVLRSYSLSSHNKTSRACQRRLLYMLKQPQTAHSVALGVEEIKQNYYVNKKYKDIVNKIKKTCDPNEQEEKITSTFKALVAYVAKKYYDLSKSKPTIESSCKPQTLQEFKIFYEVSHPQKPQKGFTCDIKNVNDIHTATINSVIYSSMCCGKDRRSWAYQLFRIYQQYPEILLRNAMAKIRADGMVSVAKHYLTALKKYGNCLPISSSQYQLSTTYLYKFQTKLPFEAFSEIQNFLESIIKGYKENPNIVAKGVNVQPPTGGMVLGIQEYLIDNKMDFNVELPDHVITLDSGIREYDETYVRIAKRYQDILLALELLNTEQTESVRPQAIASSSHQPNIEEATVEEKSNEDDRETAGDEPRIKSDSTGGNQKTKKFLTKKYQWGFYQVKGQTDEQDNEDWYFNNNDSEDEVGCIHFQDGSVVNINTSDIENSKNFTIDESIHEAFLKTHGDNFRDFIQSSSINALKEMGQSSTPMDVDEEIDQSNNLDDVEMDYDTIANTGNNHQNNSNREDRNCVEHVEIKPMCFENIKFASNSTENRDLQPGTSSNHQREDTSDAQRRYTRIALLKMREELIEDLPDSHHAHEYFAVNTFGISYLFPEIEEEKINNHEFVVDDKLFHNVLMFEIETFKKIINDLNKFAIFPRKFVDYPRVKEDLAMMTELKEEEIDLIYDYVRNKHEQGATSKELTLKFYKILGDKMYDILTFMTDQRLFLRSGVSEMHYIHYNYVDPWLIQSIRIMRLHREALPPIPPDSIYIFNSSHAGTEKSNENDDECDNSNEKEFEELSIPSSKNKKNNADKDNTIDSNPNNTEVTRSQTVDKKEKNEEETSAVNSSKQNHRKSRTCLLQTKDIYTAAKKLDLNTAEDIRVVIRPWIKIDGVINKGMLEKMLGAVLAHCIMNPGINLSQIQSRFLPALQPYHTRELVELLIKLECLTLRVLRKNTTILFSKSPSTKIYHPAKMDGSSEYGNEMIVEATTRASIRFGTFFRFYHAQRSTSDITDT